jgi:very-short-patch-repair endonuclease
MQRDPAIAAIFGRALPVVVVGDLLRGGVTRSSIAHLEQRGELVRVGKSALVTRDVLDASDPWEKFRLRSIGFGLTVGPDTYLTGWSAAALRAIPTVDDPPALPTALRHGNAHRGTDHSPYGRVRTGSLPEIHRSSVTGIRTVSLPFTVVEVARRSTAMSALVAVDFALNRGVRRELLESIIHDLRSYPGVQRAVWATAHGDPRAESALETLGRLAFIERGLEAPISNAWVDDGRRAYRADHLAPDAGVVLEGDGASKYNNRADAHKIIASRDERDRWFRRQGYAIDHYTFAVARFDRQQIVERYWVAARTRAGQSTPRNWSLDRPAWL